MRLAKHKVEVANTIGCCIAGKSTRRKRWGRTSEGHRIRCCTDPLRQNGPICAVYGLHDRNLKRSVTYIRELQVGPDCLVISVHCRWMAIRPYVLGYVGVAGTLPWHEEWSTTSSRSSNKNNHGSSNNDGRWSVKATSILFGFWFPIPIARKSQAIYAGAIISRQLPALNYHRPWSIMITGVNENSWPTSVVGHRPHWQTSTNISSHCATSFACITTQTSALHHH